MTLEASFGVVVTRVIRAEVELLAAPDLEVKFGDRFQIVGDEEGLAAATRALGNSVRELGETNFVPGEVRRAAPMTMFELHVPA